MTTYIINTDSMAQYVYCGAHQLGQFSGSDFHTTWPAVHGPLHPLAASLTKINDLRDQLMAGSIKVQF